MIVSAVEAGRAEPPRRYVYAIAEVLGVTAAWIAFGLEGERYGKRPPRAAVVTNDDLLNVSGNAPLSSSKSLERLTGSDRSKWFAVPDDAMAPLVRRGDLVLADPEVPPSPGAIVVTWTPVTASLCVGRYAPTRIGAGSPYRVVPENALYPTVEINPGKGHLFGVVVQRTHLEHGDVLQWV